MTDGTGGADRGGESSDDGGEMGPVVGVRMGTMECQGMKKADCEGWDTF